MVRPLIRFIAARRRPDLSRRPAVLLPVLLAALVSAPGPVTRIGARPALAADQRDMRRIEEEYEHKKALEQKRKERAEQRAKEQREQERGARTREQRAKEFEELKKSLENATGCGPDRARPGCDQEPKDAR